MSSPYDPCRREEALAQTQRWLVECVIGLNLCPFAKAEHVHGRIRYVVCAHADEDALLRQLQDELARLAATPAAACETTLMICPQAFGDFWDMQVFLPRAEQLLKRLKLRGVLQLAHFHPQFVFADEATDSPGHYSNRSPYPTLHVLREASIARAAESFADASEIYARNVALLERMGLDAVRQYWQKAAQP